MKQKHFIALLGAAIIIIVLFGVFTQQARVRTPATTEGKKYAGTWADIELKDVATEKKFRISDFEGKPVLLESFAVWCVTCLEQQRKIRELKAKEGDAIVHISLDTDPNEDEGKVRVHLERYGFDWLFAVAPQELTKALIDDFGLGIVNAPSAPVVLICGDQSTRFLRSGVKSADELISEVKRGC